MSDVKHSESAGHVSQALAALRWLLVILAAALPGAALAQEQLQTTPRPSRPWAGQVAFGLPIPVEGSIGGRFALQTRMGVFVRPKLQIGGVLDWHRIEGHGLIVQPSGFVLSNPVFDVFPLLGYVQYGGAGKGMTLPYAGAAVGYQLGFVEADNVDTEILGGFGWQGWVGVSRRLSGPLGPTKAMLGIEAAYNRANISGSVEDPLQGRRHETFDLSSWVLRIGFSFEAM